MSLCRSHVPLHWVWQWLHVLDATLLPCSGGAGDQVEGAQGSHPAGAGVCQMGQDRSRGQSLSPFPLCRALQLETECVLSYVCWDSSKYLCAGVFRLCSGDQPSGVPLHASR